MDITLQDAQSEWFWTKSTETLIGGSAGPGKSFFIRVASIHWALEIPNLQVYIFRRTYKDLEQNHISHPQGYPSLLAEHIEAKTVKYNTSKNIFKFDNGSMIHLCHCQHEKDVYSYQGAEIHLLLIDEATHFSKTIYNFLRGRLRQTGIKLPSHYIIECDEDERGYRTLFPRAILSANPGGVGHNWVKEMFVDYQPYKQISKTSLEDGGMYRAYYPAVITDNKKLMEEDPQYINRLKGLGNKALVRAMLDGDWDIVAGGAIDDVWNRDKQVLVPFDIPDGWFIDRGYDWGSSKPAACLWFAESDGSSVNGVYYPRGTIFVIREIYFSNGNANEGNRMLATEQANEIDKIDRELEEKGLIVNDGPADSAIYDDSTGKSIANDMEDMGITWIKSNKKPGSRIQGLQMLRKYLKNSLEDNKEEPGIYFFDCCVNTIRTLPVLPRDSKKPDDIDTNAEDHCFTGDTLVNTTLGQIQISKLVNKEGYLYSINNDVVRFHTVRETRKAECIEILFSNGDKVKCTKDHKFLTDKGWIEARYLTDVKSYGTIRENKKANKWKTLKSYLKLFKNLMELDITSVENIFKTLK